MSLYTFRGVFRQRASHAHRFVIRMGKNGQQSQWFSHGQAMLTELGNEFKQ